MNTFSWRDREGLIGKKNKNKQTKQAQNASQNRAHLCFSCLQKFSLQKHLLINHRIIEWLGLEMTFKII